jgi:hypothetical protein
MNITGVVCRFEHFCKVEGNIFFENAIWAIWVRKFCRTYVVSRSLEIYCWCVLTSFHVYIFVINFSLFALSFGEQIVDFIKKQDYYQFWYERLYLE